MLASLFVAACNSESAPPLVANGVQVFLPLPGSSASVAYFELRNNSKATISVDAIASPQFGIAAIHETTVSDGIARMQPVSDLEITAKSQLRFEPGGLHLMLMKPTEGLEVGSKVALEIHYDERGLMIINAIVQSRNP